MPPRSVLSTLVCRCQKAHPFLVPCAPLRRCNFKCGFGQTCDNGVCKDTGTTCTEGCKWMAAAAHVVPCRLLLLLLLLLPPRPC